jgi:two-component system sensor kinase FixL
MAIDLHGWVFWLASSVLFACSLILGHRYAQHRARARDLSEQLRRSRLALKRARVQLRARIERQKLTLRASNDVIFYWNANSDLLRWSANGGRFFDAPPRPRNAWRLLQRCVDKRERERVLHELQRFMAGGEAVWENEFTLRGRGRTRVPVRVRGILIRDAAGKPRKMVGALSDMTDARAAKDAARALARAARLATIGEITAGITHEVNQPLGAILNNAETGLFLLQRKRPSISMLKAILEDIRKDDLRASQVVRRTRALLQNREMVREQVNLNKVLAEAVDLLWMQARRRAITLTLSPGSIPSITGDAVHLQQVIINLIGNALDATEVDIAGSKRVEVLSQYVDGGIRVSVRDTGCGIAPEHLESIFDSFHSGKAEGLGIGLSIARAIVRAHGGHIFAENNQHGPGATVSFELPVVDASTAQFPPETLLVRQAAD